MITKTTTAREDLYEGAYVETSDWFDAECVRAIPRQRGTGRTNRGRREFYDDFVTPRFPQGKVVQLRYERSVETRVVRGREREVVCERYGVRAAEGHSLGAYAGEAITVEQANENFRVIV